MRGGLGEEGTDIPRGPTGFVFASLEFVQQVVQDPIKGVGVLLMAPPGMVFATAEE